MSGVGRRMAAGLLLFGLFFPVGLVAAQADVLDQACIDNPNASACQDDDNQEVNNNDIFGPDGLLTGVARLIAMVSGIAGIIMIVIGGFRYILASGDASNISKAKNTVLYAVVGMLVAASSQAIAVFVLSRL